MSNILDEIVSVKRDEIANLRKEFTLSRFKDSEFYEKSNISLIAAVKAFLDLVHPQDDLLKRGVDALTYPLGDSSV